MTNMDAGARAWLLKKARDNYWRVCEWYEFDDLIQDGNVCWWRIVAKYETKPGRVRTRRHLMRLFQTTYTNHLHDLAKVRTRADAEQKISDVLRANPLRHEATMWEAISDEDGDAMAYERLIVEAPPRLRDVLLELLADRSVATLRAAYRIRRDGTRETMGDRLRRLAVIPDSDYDYADELRAFLHR